MEIKGKGSIQQLDRGDRYRCRHWMLQVQTSEGRKTKRVEGSVTDAKAALQSFMDELSAERLGGLTFGEYAARWVDRCDASGAYSPNTLQRRRCGIKRVSPLLDKPICDITKDDVEDMVAALRSDGLSSTTISSYVGTVKTIMADAVSRGDIGSNPASKVKTPKRDTEPVQPLPKSELERILGEIDRMPYFDGRTTAFYLIITMGLRSEEALGLKWDCVHDGCIEIRRALKVATMEIQDTKFPSSIRTLPIPPRTQKYIDRWRNDCWSDDLVCPGRGGAILHPANLRRWAKKHGYTTRFHQLRHSYLTELAKSGCTPYVLQKIAGWSDIKMAMVYCHVDYDQMEKSISAVQW